MKAKDFIARKEKGKTHENPNPRGLKREQKNIKKQ